MIITMSIFLGIFIAVIIISNGSDIEAESTKKSYPEDLKPMVDEFHFDLKKVKKLFTELSTYHADVTQTGPPETVKEESETAETETTKLEIPTTEQTMETTKKKRIYRPKRNTTAGPRSKVSRVTKLKTPRPKLIRVSMFTQTSTRKYKGRSRGVKFAIGERVDVLTSKTLTQKFYRHGWIKEKENELYYIITLDNGSEYRAYIKDIRLAQFPMTYVSPVSIGPDYYFWRFTSTSPRPQLTTQSIPSEK